jgi:multidrug efflux pump
MREGQTEIRRENLRNSSAVTVRSFAHPFAILIATLLCMFGSLLGLLVIGQTLNISSFTRIIIVVGIVHKIGS